MTIKNFKGRETEKVFRNLFSRRLPESIQRVARRRLRLLDVATSLNDLAAIPGNHLEALTKDRKGQHSIRINRQWRVCFVWKDGQPHNVEIEDYH